jgi:hypothetical protein
MQPSESRAPMQRRFFATRASSGGRRKQALNKPPRAGHQLQGDPGHTMDNTNELAAALVAPTIAFAVLSTGCGGKSVPLGPPLNHRNAAVLCPQQRGASLPDSGFCTCGSSPCCDQCLKDSDCGQDLNGRCGFFIFGPHPLMCSYDECYSDSDCDGGVPCGCRPSGSSDEPNVCLTLSNCRVDSDCGPGGYCSLSMEGIVSAYYCHTPNDTCSNDSDCPMDRPACTFDMSSGHWACILNIPPP